MLVYILSSKRILSLEIAQYKSCEFESHYANTPIKHMIFMTLMSPGVNNTQVARVIKSDSLDCTSVPSAELINGRMLNLYECPENISLKVWKKLHKQDRLNLIWEQLPRNKRINITVSLLADAFGAQSFKWYEIK